MIYFIHFTGTGALSRPVEVTSRIADHARGGQRSIAAAPEPVEYSECALCAQFENVAKSPTGVTSPVEIAGFVKDHASGRAISVIERVKDTFMAGGVNLEYRTYGAGADSGPSERRPIDVTRGVQGQVRGRKPRIGA